MIGGAPIVIWEHKVFSYIKHAWLLLPLRATCRAFRAATETRFRQLYALVFSSCVPKCMLQPSSDVSWCSLYRMEGELFPLGSQSCFVSRGQSRQQAIDALNKATKGQYDGQKGAFVLRLSETTPHVLWVMWMEIGHNMHEERCTRHGDGYVFRKQKARTIWQLFALLMPVVGHLFWAAPHETALKRDAVKVVTALGVMVKDRCQNHFYNQSILTTPLPCSPLQASISVLGNEYFINIDNEGDVMDNRVFVTFVNAFVANRYL
jgi:hypothetical protein